MRAATGAGLAAAGSIAQMGCRVDMCLVILIVDTEGDGLG